MVLPRTLSWAFLFAKSLSPLAVDINTHVCYSFQATLTALTRLITFRKGGMLFMGAKVNRLILIIAVSAGVLSFFLAMNYLESSREEAPVLVLTRDLPEQATITRSDVRVTHVQKDAIHSSSYRTMEELFGRDGSQVVVTRGPLYAGQQLIKPMVQVGSDAKTLAFKLREASGGLTQPRAFSIRGTPENTFGGRMEPGDRVDIIAVFNRGSVVPEAVSKRVFLDVQVLDTIDTPLGGGRKQIDLITLLFKTPDEAELFSMMQHYADKINLALIPTGGHSGLTGGYDSGGLLRALGLEQIRIEFP